MNVELLHVLKDKGELKRVIASDWRSTMGEAHGWIWRVVEVSFYSLILLIVGMGKSGEALGVAVGLVIVWQWLRMQFFRSVGTWVLQDVLSFSVYGIRLGRAEPELWPEGREKEGSRLCGRRRDLAMKGGILARQFQVPWWALTQGLLRKSVVQYCSGVEVQLWEADVRIFMASLAEWHRTLKETV